MSDSAVLFITAAKKKFAMAKSEVKHGISSSSSSILRIKGNLCYLAGSMGRLLHTEMQAQVRNKT